MRRRGENGNPAALSSEKAPEDSITFRGLFYSLDIPKNQFIPKEVNYASIQLTNLNIHHSKLHVRRNNLMGEIFFLVIHNPQVVGKCDRI
jgi:hypothetical protein